MQERLDKVLVHLGLGSRKEVGRMVRQGLVQLNGQVVHDPATKLDPQQNVLSLEGQPLVYRRYFHCILHKPAGYVTSTSDRDGPPITQVLGSLWRDDWMPVGRLDKDTEGLLLLTTHGELAHRLTHPRWKVDKRYLAVLEQPATPTDVQAFAQGLMLEGQKLQAAVLLLEPSPLEVTLTIREGKYHQVKRMFAARGNQVRYLKRLSFGPLELPPDLPKGQARVLFSPEEALLYQAVGLQQP